MWILHLYWILWFCLGLILHVFCDYLFNFSFSYNNLDKYRLSKNFIPGSLWELNENTHFFFNFNLKKFDKFFLSSQEFQSNFPFLIPNLIPTISSLIISSYLFSAGLFTSSCVFPYSASENSSYISSNKILDFSLCIVITRLYMYFI
jgi:hypothetical protein